MLCLELPFFFQTESEHESLESVETEAVEFTAAVILDCVFADHLPFELIYVVLALNLRQNLNCRLLNDLRFFNLIATVLMLVHLGADRGHNFAASDRFFLLGKLYLVKEGGQGPVKRLHPLHLLSCKLLRPRHIPKVRLVCLDSHIHFVDNFAGVNREVVFIRQFFLNRRQVFLHLLNFLGRVVTLNADLVCLKQAVVGNKMAARLIWSRQSFFNFY